MVYHDLRVELFGVFDLNIVHIRCALACELGDSECQKLASSHRTCLVHRLIWKGNFGKETFSAQWHLWAHFAVRNFELTIRTTEKLFQMENIQSQWFLRTKLGESAEQMLKYCLTA